MEGAVEALRQMFPDYSTEALAEVLRVVDGDLSAATNYLLTDDHTAGLGANFGLAPGVDAGLGVGTAVGAEAVVAGIAETDALGAAVADFGHQAQHLHHLLFEDDEDEEDEDDDEVEVEAAVALRATKRLRTVEPTPPEQLEGKKCNFVKFDQIMLRKTYLVL